MKLARRILIGLAVLLVGAAVAGIVYLDKLVKLAVERGGSYALGVPTTLDEASVGLFSGRYELERLHVVNPPGFVQPDFFSVRSTVLELPLTALREQKLVVPLLQIEGIAIDLERNARGTNYGAILDNLARFEGGETPATAGGGGAGGASKGKTYTLKKLVIHDVNVAVDLLPEAGDATKVSLSIAGIVVEDLGNDMTLAQICALVVRTAVKAAVEQGAGVLPAELLQDLHGRLGALEGKAREKLDATLKKAEETVGGDAGKLLQEKGGKVGEALGGLLKKKKE